MSKVAAWQEIHEQTLRIPKLGAGAPFQRTGRPWAASRVAGLTITRYPKGRSAGSAAERIRPLPAALPFHSRNERDSRTGTAFPRLALVAEGN